MTLQIIENNEWDKIKINSEIISKPIYQNIFLIQYLLINKKFKLIQEILKIDKKNILNINPDIFINICKLNDFITIIQLLKIINNKYIYHILNVSNDDWIIFYFISSASINNIQELLSISNQVIKWDTIINNDYALKIFINRVYQLEYNPDIESILVIILDNSIKVLKEDKLSIIIDSCLEGYNEKILDILFNKFPECINIYDKNLITPLIAAIANNNEKLMKYLLDKNADYNYYGITNALMTALLTENSNIIKLLLKYDDIDINFFDSNKWQPSHYIFKNKVSLDLDIKREILTKTNNINLPNTNGNTTMHLLFLNSSWRDYTDILENKIIDLFYKNKLDLTPLDYLIYQITKNNKYDMQVEIDHILYLTATSFLNNISDISIKNKKINKNKINKNYSKLLNLSQKCLKKNTTNCIQTIATSMNTFNISSIKDLDETNINFLIDKKVDYNLFISRDIDSYIYIMYFLEKYKIAIPLALDFNQTNIIVSDNPEIEKILQFYNNITIKYPNLKNLSIYWHNKNNYLIPINLKNTLKLINNSIIFIYITIINQSMDHANCLIINSDNKSIIHFEPYGIINKQDLEDLDSKLQNYFKDIYPDYKYYSPSDFMTINSFQRLSNERDKLEEKIGDNGGFCLAWSLWFLELYLNNRDVDLHILIDKSIRKIIDSKYSFLEYIRFYANKLRRFHIKYLNKIKYPAERIFNIYTSGDENIYIYNAINTDLIKYKKN